MYLLYILDRFVILVYLKAQTGGVLQIPFTPHFLYLCPQGRHDQFISSLYCRILRESVEKISFFCRRREFRNSV